MGTDLSWDDQRIFLAVLEAGSLAGAGRSLGLSHPTVRTRIESLERALDTVLFTRSVNGLAPTETAEELREAARTMAMASSLFVRQASGTAGEIVGTVRLSVPEVMGVEVLPGMLRSLREKHPRLRVEMSLSDSQADVLAHEVDVAVRTAETRQGSLTARRVSRIPLGFFASPDYVRRRGMPATMDALADHDLIGPDRSPSDLALAERLGPLFAPNRFVLRSDSHPAQLAAARASVGIAVCQVPLCEADPRLMRVVPGYVVHFLDVWLVTHPNLVKVARVRAVLDHFAAEFGGPAPARRSDP
jgi:DNA-binding transcriptional LysR family regulator